MALGSAPVTEQRRKLLSEARGNVLEIGFGTGLNLSLYPDAIAKITAVDPNPGMNRRAQHRIKQSKIAVE
jgi:ubiquinone/menaquinone biosynthesis C-methylase UbiE